MLSWYNKSTSGDIVAIYDTWGVAVAKYVYDAWGNHKIYDEWGAAGGALGGIIAGPGGASLASQAVKFLKHPISNMVSEFVENLILAFSEWYFESGVEDFGSRLIGKDWFLWIKNVSVALNGLWDGLFLSYYF